MSSHPIEDITSSEIASLLGLKHIEIIDRDLILKNSSTKKIEHIKWRENSEAAIKEVFIKYGTTPSFIKEILFYDALSKPVRKFIPQLTSYQFNPERYIMILEWINGENPDLSNHHIVKKVFRNLGFFAACFENPILRFRNGKIKGLLREKSRYGMNEAKGLVNNLFEKQTICDNLIELGEFRKIKEDTIKNIGGEKLLLFLERLQNGWIDHIVNTIYYMPLTIHPGDVSKFNMLIRNSNNGTVFFDFENMKITPMCQLMEYIGEKDIHVPPEQLSKLALKSYLNGWNSKSKNKINWNKFYNSYIYTRIYYKCYLLSWWLKREGTKGDPGIEWISQHVNDLSALVDMADTPPPKK
ncbi:hypothetical protein [Heyndrickxia acidicola]|uniref:Aminoglycoside phosphotransferase domain-containing protein n=1 Tax=Heyndrickxia acidicola TaxID=209389 RepID=A0ABU6MH00_9BACI|nr:hypothetical protein [Heyndrickxia acidicola]MED1203677.1 hypothetical protein [Heyndrickxia acidicola]